jgi:tetratricopeptide (TPR) repeat protein
MPKATEPSAGHSPSRAAKLGISEHALAVLEYQARRHYGRWRLERAEKIARRVIRFDVGRAGAWFVLGDIEMRRTNHECAFGHFQQAVDCNRGDAMAWCRGAEALLGQGDHERAEQWLEEAIRLGSADASAGAKRALSILERYADVFKQRRRKLPAGSEQAPTRRIRALGAADGAPADRSTAGGVRPD